MSTLLNIYKDVISYGSFTVAALFGILTILFHFNLLRTKTLKIISLVSIIGCTIISLEYYLFQLFYSPISLLIPISILVIMIDGFMEPISTVASKTLYVLNGIYLIIGLALLTVSNNTWGNIETVLGMFIVPNTLLIVIYLSHTIKNYIFLSISCIIVAFVSILFIYLVTDGYQYSEYDGVFVEEKRWIANAIGFLFFLNGILFYLKRKKTTPYRVF